MDVGFGLIGLLIVVWVVGDLVIVGVALYGAGARLRRAARLDAARAHLRVPVATLRPGAVRGCSSPGRRRAPLHLR